MKTFEQIASENKNGTFYAIGDNGKQYNATYNAELGCMFFCIPSSVEIVGYIER